MKKLFSALMILLLLAAFVSCNEPEPEATEQPAPETEAPAAKPTLVENGEAAYAIILPEGSRGDITNILIDGLFADYCHSAVRLLSHNILV